MSDEKKRIIVVQDESSVREMVAKMLASNGYDVEQAQDGLDGLTTLWQRRRKSAEA